MQQYVNERYVINTYCTFRYFHTKYFPFPECREEKVLYLVISSLSKMTLKSGLLLLLLLLRRGRCRCGTGMIEVELAVRASATGRTLRRQLLLAARIVEWREA